MSTVRLSVLGDTAYAPTSDGALVMQDYARRRRLGRLDTLVRPNMANARSTFRHYLELSTADAVQNLRAGEPVIVMVHGFLFDPKGALSPGRPEDTDNPHGRCFHYEGDHRESDEQRHHTSSWPLRLGFSEHDTDGETGLAVAFGWQSQPGFASSLIERFQNFYARAYDKAEESAWVLINTLRELDKVIDGRPIDLFCHSLGSRVVVRALALLASDVKEPLIERIGRVVILGGAEYVVEAQLMMRRVLARLPEGGPVFYNFVSRENDVLDKLGENFGPRTFGNTQVIGHNGLGLEGSIRRGSSIGNPLKNWMDFQIDSGELQAWMEGRGLQVSGDRPGNVWDHWFYYTFRGNMDVYRGIFRDRKAWRLEKLRKQKIPEGVSLRWWNFGD